MDLRTVATVWIASLIYCRNDISSLYLLFSFPLFLKKKVTIVSILFLLCWESFELCYYLQKHESHLKYPVVIHDVFDADTLKEINELSMLCNFQTNKNYMMFLSSASHRDCPYKMDEIISSVKLQDLIGFPNLVLAPDSDLSRWSVLLYNNGNFMRSHVDGNMYYGSRVSGSIVLNNSAFAIMRVDDKNYTLDDNTVILFEGNRHPHSVEQIRSDVGNHRLVINFIMINQKKTQYRVSLLSRFHRLIVNVVYYSSFNFS